MDALTAVSSTKMSKQRVVIIGGGFGGAFTAKYLRRYAAHDFEVELINTTNYFVFQPLLPEVAAATISAPDAVTPVPPTSKKSSI